MITNFSDSQTHSKHTNIVLSSTCKHRRKQRKIKLLLFIFYYYYGFAAVIFTIQLK